MKGYKKVWGYYIPEESTPTKRGVAEALHGAKIRSAWSRGVAKYAVQMFGKFVDHCERHDRDMFEGRVTECDMLNAYGRYGVQYQVAWNVKQWEGVCTELETPIEEIARDLCTPCEFERVMRRKNRKGPNPRETWIQTQARAYFQAAILLSSIINALANNGDWH